MSSASPKPTLAIWHGYLLGATGSNIYTNQLVRAWVRAGHDVILACQESDPTVHPSIQEVITLAWAPDGSGEQVIANTQIVRARAAGEGRCVMVRPDIDHHLPVYVLDRYEGYDVVRLVDMSTVGRERYAQAQAAAMRFVIEAFAPAGVLINHATPLPAALAPVLNEAGIPYAVKVHGSELEYALVEDPSLGPAAAAALETSASIVVGSDHIARRTAELLGATCIEGRVDAIPPGVDLEEFVPSPAGFGGDVAGRQRLRAVVSEHARRSDTARGTRERAVVRELVEEGSATALIPSLGALAGTYAERFVEATAAPALERISSGARLITFVGKLIPQKGTHLLLAALPDVLHEHNDAHLVIAGFGPLRDVLEAQLVAMQTGNIAALETIARDAGTLAGEGVTALRGLGEFIDLLRERELLDSWLERCAATRVAERVTFLGLVDHHVLKHLWPNCETSVVPSILAEAFGMVAAEAAACGCVPLVSDHSGLADAATVIERADVTPIRVNFDDPARMVPRLADALITRLGLDPVERDRQAAAARANVAAEWGWNHLAEIVANRMCGVPR